MTIYINVVYLIFISVIFVTPPSISSSPTDLIPISLQESLHWVGSSSYIKKLPCTPTMSTSVRSTTSPTTLLRLRQLMLGDVMAVLDDKEPHNRG